MEPISKIVVKLLLKAWLGIDADPRLVDLIVDMNRTSYLLGQASILEKITDTDEKGNLS